VSLSGSTGEMLGNSPTTTATPSNDLTNHFKNKKEDKLAAELNSKNAAAPTENTASLGDVHDTLKSMLETFKNNTDILSSVKENTGASVKPLRLIANNV
jgi:Mg2+ and Co2+ transporter CorA